MHIRPPKTAPALTQQNLPKKAPAASCSAAKMQSAKCFVLLLRSAALRPLPCFDSAGLVWEVRTGLATHLFPCPRWLERSRCCVANNTWHIAPAHEHTHWGGVVSPWLSLSCAQQHEFTRHHRHAPTIRGDCSTESRSAACVRQEPPLASNCTLSEGKHTQQPAAKLPQTQRRVCDLGEHSRLEPVIHQMHCYSFQSLWEKEEGAKQATARCKQELRPRSRNPRNVSAAWPTQHRSHRNKPRGHEKTRPTLSPATRLT